MDFAPEGRAECGVDAPVAREARLAGEFPAHDPCMEMHIVGTGYFYLRIRHGRAYQLLYPVGVHRLCGPNLILKRFMLNQSRCP